MRILSMDLIKKLFAAGSVFMLSSAVLATSPIQPAASAAKPTTAQNATPAIDDEPDYEDLLPQGGKIAAGDPDKNEFFILGDQEPTPEVKMNVAMEAVAHHVQKTLDDAKIPAPRIIIDHNEKPEPKAVLTESIPLPANVDAPAMQMVLNQSIYRSVQTDILQALLEPAAKIQGTGVKPLNESPLAIMVALNKPMDAISVFENNAMPTYAIMTALAKQWPYTAELRSTIQSKALSAATPAATLPHGYVQQEVIKEALADAGVKVGAGVVTTRPVMVMHPEIQSHVAANEQETLLAKEMLKVEKPIALQQPTKSNLHLYQTQPELINTALLNPPSAPMATAPDVMMADKQKAITPHPMMKIEDKVHAIGVRLAITGQPKAIALTAQPKPITIAMAEPKATLPGLKESLSLPVTTVPGLKDQHTIAMVPLALSKERSIAKAITVAMAPAKANPPAVSSIVVSTVAASKAPAKPLALKHNIAAAKQPIVKKTALVAVSHVTSKTMSKATLAKHVSKQVVAQATLPKVKTAKAIKVISMHEAAKLIQVTKPEKRLVLNKTKKTSVVEQAKNEEPTPITKSQPVFASKAPKKMTKSSPVVLTDSDTIVYNKSSFKVKKVNIGG